MPQPNLVLHNARIYPDVRSRKTVQALAIWNGRVTDLGSDREILRSIGKETIKRDLHGRVILPGFCDSHIHLLNYGMLLKTLDLSNTRTIAAIERKVAQAASSENGDEWILGRGWDDEKLLEHRYPDRYDLDRATNNPVFLKRVCGHVALANTRALSLAGIDRSTPNPEGGIIIKAPGGEPNGVLKEQAIGLVERVVPRPSIQETKKVLAKASRRLARLGITSLHCIVSDLGELVALRQLKQDREIPQSIYAVVPLSLFDQMRSAGLSTERGDADFRIGGLKLFLDGSLGAHTAALKSAYDDLPGSNGMLTMKRSDLEQIAHRAKAARFQLCIHAIGDRAVDLAVNVLEEVFGTYQGRVSRNRIEHASLTDKKSIRKMNQLGIVASVQPRFIYSDSWAAKRLGPRRLKGLYPFASLIGQGVVLAAGSDCPVEDPNPFEGVWAATTRPGLDGGEALTTSQAMAAYSLNAAYSSFCEDVRGTLEPGKMADIVVVDRDPFESSPEEIRSTRVLETFVEGMAVS